MSSNAGSGRLVEVAHITVLTSTRVKEELYKKKPKTFKGLELEIKDVLGNVPIGFPRKSLEYIEVRSSYYELPVFEIQFYKIID